MEPARASLQLEFLASGMILAHTCRGMVNRGDLLALIVRDVDPHK
jgi:predicted deacylase